MIIERDRKEPGFVPGRLCMTVKEYYIDLKKYARDWLRKRGNERQLAHVLSIVRESAQQSENAIDKRFIRGTKWMVSRRSLRLDYVLIKVRSGGIKLRRDNSEVSVWESRRLHVGQRGFWLPQLKSREVESCRLYLSNTESSISPSWWWLSGELFTESWMSQRHPRIRFTRPDRHHPRITLGLKARHPLTMVYIAGLQTLDRWVSLASWSLEGE